VLNKLHAVAAVYLDTCVLAWQMSLSQKKKQRDGRPAEYKWRRLFNAAKFG